MGTLRYVQLMQRIGDLIDDGTFSPGSRLPCQEQLMLLSGYSRITVRRAVDELCRSGKIVHRKGAGFEVPGLAVCLPLGRPSVLSGVFGQTYVQVISEITRAATAQECQEFELAEESTVTEIIRLFLKDKPVMLQTYILPEAYFEVSQCQAVCRGGEPFPPDAPPWPYTERITAVGLAAWQRRLLQCQLADACMCLVRQYQPQGQSVCRMISIIPGEWIELEVKL